jgi:hypothetical protein
LSTVVWFFLWLPEEVLALLFLLHRENGDFSLLMKDMASGKYNTMQDTDFVMVCQNFEQTIIYQSTPTSRS